MNKEYKSKFTNPHGDNWIFIYNYSTDKGYLSGSDINWEKHEVSCGFVKEVILDPEEELWLLKEWKRARENIKNKKTFKIMSNKEKQDFIHSKEGRKAFNRYARHICPSFLEVDKIYKHIEDPDNKFHYLFNWNDKEAAKIWRRLQIQTMIMFENLDK